jgi:hypothetical protein
LDEYGRHVFQAALEHLDSVGGSHSRIDYRVTLNKEPVVLVEVKSPSVMRHVCDNLPPDGIKLPWLRGLGPVPRIFQKVST